MAGSKAETCQFVECRTEAEVIRRTYEEGGEEIEEDDGDDHRLEHGFLELCTWLPR